MQAELGQRVEQVPKLGSTVVVARKILDHQTDTEPFRFGHELLKSTDILLDEKAAVVHGSVPVRMQIHPAGSDDAEVLQAAAQLTDARTPQFFESAAHREIIRGVSHYVHLV